MLKDSAFSTRRRRRRTQSSQPPRYQGPFPSSSTQLTPQALITSQILHTIQYRVNFGSLYGDPIVSHRANVANLLDPGW